MENSSYVFVGDPLITREVLLQQRLVQSDFKAELPVESFLRRESGKRLLHLVVLFHDNIIITKTFLNAVLKVKLQ